MTEKGRKKGRNRAGKTINLPCENHYKSRLRANRANRAGISI
jgi:hypothetical protein